MRYLLLLLICARLLGATYYVDPSGSDTIGTGSVGAPWRQPAKAAAVVSAGDIVNLAAGTYQSFAITRSGSSGSPITWTGTLSGTNQVAIIDAGTTLSDEWVEDTGVAAGVYKHTDAPWQPGVLFADGARVYQLTLNGESSIGYTFSQLVNLLKPAAGATTAGDSGWWTRTDEYWDGVEASWTRDPATGTLYIRFRNGDNPNDKEIKIASNNGFVVGVASGYAVRVSADWNILEKLVMTGANAAVLIDSGADNNRVRDNKIVSGQYGVVTPSSASASSNVIERNNVVSQMWGDAAGDFGQWGGTSSDVGNQEFIRWRRYWWPKKFEYAITATMINLAGKGAGNVVAYNYIHDATVGIGMGYASVNPMQTGLVVASNVCAYLSSVGLLIESGQTDFAVSANVISNANIAIRYQNLNYNNASGGSPHGLIYRNVSVLTNGFGTHCYWGYASGGTRQPAITNYHNTFTGGASGMSISIADFATFDGLVNYRWHNNIWSTLDTFNLTTTVANDAATWAAFTYNIVKDSAVGYPWWGAGNQQITSLYWPHGTWPELTESMTAVDSGVVLTGYPDIVSDALPDKGALPYNPEPVLPQVSLSSSASEVFERGSAITIYITRTGSTASALTGSWTIGGTADNGYQCSTIPGTWQIDAGQSTESVTLTPLDDGGYTGPLEFEITLTDEETYNVAGGPLVIRFIDSAINPVALRGPYFPGQGRPPR